MSTSESARKALKKWRCSLVCSIVAMFCCFPFGIASCVKVLSARKFYDIGDYNECVRQSDNSFKFVLLASLIGGFVWGTLFFIVLPTILSVHFIGSP
jgi:hypothetical protein